MVVLDHLNPNSFARANQSHTQVECSCVGLEPGQAYTTTQLLAGLLMVSGNDAANMLADMLGGQRAAVAAMNAKAQQLGAAQYPRVVAVRTRRARLGNRNHPLRSRADLSTGTEVSADRPDLRSAQTASFPGKDGALKQLDAQNELLTRYPGDFAGKTGYTDLARKTFVTAAQRNGRRLLVVLMYGTGDYYGQAIRLFDWGFSQ